MKKLLITLLFSFLFIGFVSAGTFQISGANLPDKIYANSNPVDIFIKINATDYSGNMVISVNADKSFISPTSQNSIIGNGENDVKFMLSTLSTGEGLDTLHIQVCETNQFTVSSCDKKDISFIIYGQEKPSNNQGLYFLIGCLMIIIFILFYLLYRKKQKKK